FLYCNDFDATPVPELASIGTVELTGGQLVLSNAVAHSPPRSLLASVRGTASTAGVTHALGTAPDGLTFSFDLLVSEWNTTDGQLSKIELSDGTTECAVRLDGNATTWALTQVCTSGGTETARSTTDSEIAIVRGRWQTFALRISFADPPSVKLDIDSTRVVDDLAVAPLTRAQTSIVLGTTLVPSGSVTIFQDNVLVTSP
ncbi:MAG TPA: hypothetical protein VM580_01355, partial [Labilithrix sp.]|nr:hypothetical protein [Labilithrix sp.]